MTDATVDEVLGGVLYLLVVFAAAIGGFAGAIVGLWMLKYLAGTLGEVANKLESITKRRR